MTYHNKTIAALASILIVAIIVTTPLSAFADSVHSAPRIKLKEGTAQTGVDMHQFPTYLRQPVTM